MESTTATRNRRLTESKSVDAADKVIHVKQSRRIPEPVAVLLWGRSAGRCQISGCNTTLYRSPLTQDSINRAEKAHIYSFAKRGPRGWGRRQPHQLNDISNLMLVCQPCHLEIDAKPHKFTAELLMTYKLDHESRIELASSIVPNKKSRVVLYGANIGGESSTLLSATVNEALFPDFYPASEHPIEISMRWEGRDSTTDYWQTEAKNLEAAFQSKVAPLIESGDHLSIFGRAPIPLLVLLGTLLTDRAISEVRQLQREPTATWNWASEEDEVCYQLNKPESTTGTPALVISLSAEIDRKRVTDVLGSNTAVWELTIDEPHNDFLKTRSHLSSFRSIAREAIAHIARQHGHDTPLAIFPAMPVSTAIELGRVRTPKADMPWTIYDQNKKSGTFTKAVEIGVRQ